MNCKDLFAFVVLAALLAGCGKQKDEKDEPKQATSEKAAGEPESRVKHDTNGEVTVTVEIKLQQKIGLQTAALEPAQLSPELRAYGRVLDPSGLASLAGDLMTAEAAAQASQAELKRLKTLAAQSNASDRALQAAQSAAVHDLAQVQSVRLHLLASWGSAISQRNDLGDLVQSLGSLASALVQLEVPANDSPRATPTGARIFTLGDETKPIAAELLGPAPSVDPQMQGRGYLLLVSTNSAGLAPGAAVTGYLDLPGEPRKGVLLPRSAVVRFIGSNWVYVPVTEETFQRRGVVLDSPLEKGWFVSSGLKPQDKVVTVGGQQLLSEELKGQSTGD
jgi:multidrug efflux pump subunit AcrA (membrane-fusion protein)